MAEYLIKAQLPHVSVASAGINAMVGRAAHPIACELMQELGSDISSHRAKQISVSHCQQAEIILVMSGEQRRILEREYPFLKGRVFKLGEYGGFDVHDPYGQSRPQFESALDLIQNGVNDWIKRIRDLK